ncbi:MAG: DUF2065 family protein [Elusimicrobiota bacterium]|nr:DUF2065 family protein [Elusimicrobiota bacterium]
MTISAKVILYILIAEGALMLLAPGKAAEVIENFAEIKSSAKRIMGAGLVIAGALLFWLPRRYMTEFTPHWIISVAGIMIFLEGLAYFIAPGAVVKFSRWFMAEKGPVRVTGAVFIAAAVLLLKLI